MIIKWNQIAIYILIEMKLLRKNISIYLQVSSIIIIMHLDGLLFFFFKGSLLLLNSILIFYKLNIIFSISSIYLNVLFKIIIIIAPVFSHTCNACRRPPHAAGFSSKILVNRNVRRSGHHTHSTPLNIYFLILILCFVVKLQNVALLHFY